MKVQNDETVSMHTQFLSLSLSLSTQTSLSTLFFSPVIPLLCACNWVFFSIFYFFEFCEAMRLLISPATAAPAGVPDADTKSCST